MFPQKLVVKESIWCLCLLSPEQMEWWAKMMYPVQRVWFGVATRFGIRKTGLLKLRHDVRACEYEDIHVMWDMLKRSETEFVESPAKSKKRHYWKLFRWARCAPCICRSS